MTPGNPVDGVTYALLLVVAGALLLAVDLGLDRLLAGKPWRLSLMWVIEAALTGFLWIAATAISGVIDFRSRHHRSGYPPRWL